MAPQPPRFSEPQKIELLVGHVVEQMRKTGQAVVAGNRVESPGHGLTLFEYVEIGENKHQVTQVDDNGFEVSGTPTGDAWRALAPYYMYGTPLDVNQEQMEEQDSWKKFPLILLFTPRHTTWHTVGHKAKYTPELQVFFLDEPKEDNESWDTETHFRQVIDRERERLHQFTKTMERHPNFVWRIPEFQTTDHAKWGAYVMDQGNQKHIISANLSGTELKISPGVTYRDCKT